MKEIKSEELPGLMPMNELRRILRKYAGVRARVRPKPGEEKSKNFTVWDIALICSLHDDRSRIYRFLKHEPKWGGLSKKALHRLNETITLLENRMITKSQYGVYHFHEKPVKPPVREMKVNLFGGVRLLPGVTQAITPKRTEMPRFDSIFGRK